MKDVGEAAGATMLKVAGVVGLRSGGDTRQDRGAETPGPTIVLRKF
jgi:hypothetical protein